MRWETMMKLKPCPFCGCTDVNVVDGGNFSFIECSGCLGAFYQREACSVEDNVEAWNKRKAGATAIGVVKGDVVIQKGQNNKHIVNNGTMTMTFGK